MNRRISKKRQERLFEDLANAVIDRLVDLKKEIMRLIALVEDKDQRLLLELRYLCWKQ